MITIIRRLYRVADSLYEYTLLAGAVLFLLGTVIDMNPLKSLSVGLILLYACFHIGKKVFDNEIMVLLGVVALCGHFFMAICWNYFFGDFAADSVEYHFIASGMADNLHNGVSLTAIPVFKQYYTHFITILYYLFGANRLMGAFIFGFFTVLAGIIMHLACWAAKMHKTVGYFAAAGTWFMPGFLFFTSDLMKDSAVLLMTAMSFYLFSLLIYGEHSKLKTGLLVLSVALSVTAAAVIRFYVFVPAIAGFGLSLAFYLVSKKTRRFYFMAVGLLVLFASLFFILSRHFLSKWIDLDLDKMFASLNNIRQYVYAYASSGIKGYDISSLAKALRELPVLCVHYLLQPFPSSWLTLESTLYKLLIPDMLLWYAMLPFVFIGSILSVVKRNYLGLAAVGFFTVFLCMDALVIGNVGSLYRLRLQLQEIGFVLAGLGMVSFEKNKKYYAVLVVVGFCLCLLLNLYVGLQYADGRVDLFGSPLALEYRAEQDGQYMLRYHVNTPKQNDDDAPTQVSIQSTVSGQMVSSAQYDATAIGYANLYFEADAGETFVVVITGRRPPRLAM